MGSFGPIHWIIVAGVILLLFGGRIKLSSIMGDAAKGIKAFRDGLKDEHDASGQTPTSTPTPTPLPSAEKEKDPVAR
jgi:sec-independent protein translocase protein TatA